VAERWRRRISALRNMNSGGHMNKLPNFLYIGTSKAGSTWIFKALSWHPQIYMYPGKDLGFFTKAFDNGLDWYASQFTPEPQHRIVGEVAHSYLVSQAALERIHEHLPDVKLMVCLREPVERTFSQYLDGIKNGKLHDSLEQELERTASLISRSRYGTHLERYLERFDRSQIHVGSFDELVSAPDQFAAKVFEFLGVDVLQIPKSLQQKVLPAATPRSRTISTATKTLSRLAYNAGLKRLRGKFKTSPTVRNLLYRPYADDSRPTICPIIEARLRQLMTEEVQRLDSLAGTDFCRLWNYPPADQDDGRAGRVAN
jgi:hypothetical protein